MASRKKRLEFSKKIIIAIQILFSIAMVMSYVLPAILIYMDKVAIGIFQTVATLTGSTQLAYYGKAGFENYDKNKRLLGFQKDEGKDKSSEDMNCEGGAG